MYKFFNKKGETVFSDDDFEKVKSEALKYKQKENLKALQICTKEGRFHKWI